MQTLESQLDGVRRLIQECLHTTSLGPLLPDIVKLVGSGKMLRARLAIQLGDANGTDPDTILHAGAAIEMIHGASLLHDDVIDGASLRRSDSTFWIERGTSAAILLGDLFYCRAIGLIGNVCNGALTPVLVSKAGEMCDAEAEQELLLRGAEATWEKSVSIARRKTGSLFAFVGRAAGGNDPTLSAALEEASYKIGTAYQIADDLLDAWGDEETAGKTLGTDHGRQKMTAASELPPDSPDPRLFIDELVNSAESMIEPWPELQIAWNAYFENEIQPAIDRFTAGVPA